MNSVIIGFSGLYRNADGTFTLGSVHSSEACVIASINPEDDRVFFGAIPIELDPALCVGRKTCKEIYADPVAVAAIETCKAEASARKGFAQTVREAGI